VQGLQAAQGTSGFGEPGRVVAPRGHVHGRVFRRERDCADAADRGDAEFESLYGGLRTKAPRAHRARGFGRLPEHGRRGAEDARRSVIRTPPWLVMFIFALFKRAVQGDLIEKYRTRRTYEYEHMRLDDHTARH